MAEKKVSVRLAAEGGRAVRAEMEGIGAAGAKGFGRLSKEAEAANARLAAFARAAKLAAAAVGAAVLASGVAMVRSGLQTIDAQAKLAQSLGTTVTSIQTLERAGELAGVSMGGIEQATKDLTRRLSQAAAGTGPAAAALERLGLSATDLIALPLDQRVGAINAAIEAFVPAAERAAVAGQLFGEEGSIAMARFDAATLRQATTDVRDFGVAVSEADAARIEITNDALSRLGLVWRGIANQLTAAVAPALEAVANALASATRVGGAFQSSIGFLGDNLGEIASIAGAFAAFFAGRFVLAMGAAVLALRGVTFGLVAFKGALIRTGVGALIVGLGELAFRMNLFGGAADRSSAAQTRMNAALDLYAGVGGPNARNEAIASTEAYIAEAAAKLEDAEATLAQMRAKQIAGRALLDRNALTRDDNSPGSTGEAMARNVALAAAAVVALQTDLDTARTRLRDMEEADPAEPLNAAIPAANALAGALGGAAGQASALSRFLADLPGAVASAGARIAGIRASLAALEGGGDAAAAAVAKYRAELVATLPALHTLQDGQRRFVQASIEEKVRLFAEQQALAAEEQKQLAALATAELGRAGPPGTPGASGAAASQADQVDQARAAFDRLLASLDPAVAAAQTFAASQVTINDALNAGAISAGAAAQALDLLNASVGVGVSIWAKTGAALAEYATRATDTAGQVGDVLVGAFQNADNAFRSFIEGGKVSFRGFVASLAADLASQTFRANVLGPLAGLVSGGFGGASGGASTGTGSSLFGGNVLGNLFGGLFGSAKGNIFASGRPVPFATGGVIDGPTVFPIRGGRTGLMGEAGPEAILPLARIGGRLGVETTGRGGGGTVDVRVFVDQSGNWQAEVARISGLVTAHAVAVSRDDERRTFGDRLNAFQARGTT